MVLFLPVGRRAENVTALPTLLSLTLRLWVATAVISAVHAGKWNRRPFEKRLSADFSWGRLCSINNRNCRDVPAAQGCSPRQVEQTKQNDAYDSKFSRVSMVVSDEGVESLRQSRVLLVGASKVSSEIITHLLRSGVGTVEIWDPDVGRAKDVVSQALLLQPDANLKLLEAEPEYEKLCHHAVIFVDQPIHKAIEVNAVTRNKTKFIYVTSIGVYGLVLSDFGDQHRVQATSDMQNAEHQASLSADGENAAIEVSADDGILQYVPGDIIRISMPKYLMPDNEGNAIDTGRLIMDAEVLKVEPISEQSVKLVINTDTRDWPKGVFYVRKVDAPTNFRFVSLGDLVKGLFGGKPRLWESLLHLFRRNSINPGRLVIAPSEENAFNEKVITVAAALMASQGGQTQPMGNTEKVENDTLLAKCCRRLYPNVDKLVIKTFSTLRHVDAPAIVTLMGSLAAQEAIKGLTSMFTPAEIIMVDRSDIFPNNGVGISMGDAQAHIQLPSRCGYLLVGAGALGCEYLKLIARMGVEYVTVLDDDVVDVSNLTRQNLFTMEDVGSSKAVAAVKNLQRMTNRRLQSYTPRNVAFTENFRLTTKAPVKHTVLLSAVDNIHARMLMDNYAVENSHVFVEAGIHGMQCSTFISVPYFTETYGSTVGSEAFLDASASCSVKGVPRTIVDAVFYAIELYSWVFNEQHDIFHKFYTNPLGTIRSALQLGDKHFVNVIESILSNSQLLSSSLTPHEWAAKAYAAHFKVDLPLKKMLIDAMAGVKKRSMHSVTTTPHERLDYTNTLMQDAVNIIESHLRSIKRPLKDQDFITCVDAVKRLFSDPGVKKLLRQEVKMDLQPLSFDENDANDRNCLFAASNMRAYNFGIGQKDMSTIIKIAKRIVPAISTTVGIAASMAILEIYKALPLMEVASETNAEIPWGKWSKHTTENNVAYAKSNGHQWFLLDSNGPTHSASSKIVASLRLVDYQRNQDLQHGLRNNFFNLSIMKYISNHANPPDLYEISSAKALLKGSVFSAWDYITIQDVIVKPTATDATQPPIEAEDDRKLKLGDLAYLLGKLFDAESDAFYAFGTVVTLSERNTRQSVRGTFHVRDTVVLRVVARDNQTLQPTDLPHIIYRL
ncbi:ubiquitin activating enzyme E1 [Babesia ovata]|uniref:Ubiquitin activating enzyme E1 n=1 Tax=Babesia ovata TaxID=189622 RepID=A0A2H6K7I9_9APIC|nr:ubiquitin activating enzyme E1 [Babesia ovata]GBE58963.1 ubiquitin activating enzyme E1 [Babesia ovata]